MAIINNKSNKIPYNSVAYEFDKQLVSSDLNEMQSVIVGKLSNYLSNEEVGENLNYTIDKYTTLSNGVRIDRFRYLVKDPAGNIYVGSLSPTNVVLTSNSLVQDSSYKVIMYYKYSLFTCEDNLYENGIRSNSYTPSIIEISTPNNIKDTSLNLETSARYGLEFTFVLLKESDQVPSIAGFTQVTDPVVEFDVGHNLNIINVEINTTGNEVVTKNELLVVEQYINNSINQLSTELNNIVGGRSSIINSERSQVVVVNYETMVSEGILTIPVDISQGCVIEIDLTDLPNFSNITDIIIRIIGLGPDVDISRLLTFIYKWSNDSNPTTYRGTFTYAIPNYTVLYDPESKEIDYSYCYGHMITNLLLVGSKALVKYISGNYVPPTT